MYRYCMAILVGINFFSAMYLSAHDIVVFNKYGFEFVVEHREKKNAIWGKWHAKATLAGGSSATIAIDTTADNEYRIDEHGQIRNTGVLCVYKGDSLKNKKKWTVFDKNNSKLE